MKQWFLKHGAALTFIVLFTAIVSAVCIPNIPTDETMERALTVVWSLSLADSVLALFRFFRKKDSEGNPMDIKQNVEYAFAYSGQLFLFGGILVSYTLKPLQTAVQWVFLGLALVCGAVYGGIKLAKAIKKTKTRTSEKEKPEE